MIAWDKFSSNLFYHTNNIHYSDKSLNRKRFCCVKVVNCKCWAELLSARFHPGLVEFLSARLNLIPQLIPRMLQDIFRTKSGTAEMSHSIMKFRVCVDRKCSYDGLVKHRRLIGCGALTVSWKRLKWKVKLLERKLVLFSQTRTRRKVGFLAGVLCCSNCAFIEQGSSYAAGDGDGGALMAWEPALAGGAQGQGWGVPAALLLLLKHLWAEASKYGLRNTFSASLYFFSISFYYVFTLSHLK